MNKEDNKLKFSELFVTFMHRKNINISDISRDLDISRRSLSSWVNGSHYPKQPLVIKLAEVLGLSSIELNNFLLAAGFSPISYIPRDIQKRVQELVSLLNLQNEKYIDILKLAGYTAQPNNESFFNEHIQELAKLLDLTDYRYVDFLQIIGSQNSNRSFLDYPEEFQLALKNLRIEVDDLRRDVMLLRNEIHNDRERSLQAPQTLSQSKIPQLRITTDGKVWLGDTIVNGWDKISLPHRMILEYLYKHKGVKQTEEQLRFIGWPPSKRPISEDTVRKAINKLITILEPNPQEPVYLKRLSGKIYFLDNAQ